MPDQSAIDQAKVWLRKGIHTSVLAVGSERKNPRRDTQGRFVYNNKGQLQTTAIDPKRLSMLARAGQGNWSLFHGDDRDIEEILHGVGYWVWKQQHKSHGQGMQWRELSGFFVLLAMLCMLPIFRRGARQ